jgi:hypothetical protein
MLSQERLDRIVPSKWIGLWLFVGLLVFLGFTPQESYCGTCWDNDAATCIIDTVLVDDACDSESPGCYPP